MTVETARAMMNNRRISRATGLSESFVSRIFRGARRPSVENAKLIAQAMGVEVEDLLQYLGLTPKRVLR